MKDYIKERLQYYLDSLDKLFEDNELAYLSSHCKNELQIRDRIAWRLHQDITKEYGDLYVVRREWAPKEKSRVDLAILEMDANKEKVENVIALIEFKAQSIVKREQWYFDEFSQDVIKMREFKKKSPCTDADLYFVFLETGQWSKADKYKSILGYSIYQNGRVKYRQDSDYLSSIKSHWEEFGVVLGKSISTPDPEAIEIGEAFGYKQYVSPLLIGPLK